MRCSARYAPTWPAKSVHAASVSESDRSKGDRAAIRVRKVASSLFSDSVMGAMPRVENPSSGYQRNQISACPAIGTADDRSGARTTPRISARDPVSTGAKSTTRGRSVACTMRYSRRSGRRSSGGRSCSSGCGSNTPPMSTSVSTPPGRRRPSVAGVAVSAGGRTELIVVRSRPRVDAVPRALVDRLRRSAIRAPVLRGARRQRAAARTSARDSRRFFPDPNNRAGPRSLSRARNRCTTTRPASCAATTGRPSCPH